MTEMFLPSAKPNIDEDMSNSSYEINYFSLQQVFIIFSLLKIGLFGEIGLQL